MTGYLCLASIYEYKGWIFEFSYAAGPWPLKKDGELRKRAGKKFWDMFNEFIFLSDEEQKTFRVSGGCIPF